MKDLSTITLALLCILLAPIASAQTIWTGDIDTVWVGSGSQVDPYQISTAEELAGLAEIVNSKKSDFAGKYICLTADIYLNNESTPDSLKLEWPRIGGVTREQIDGNFNYDTTQFCGSFDGRNHTVYGVYYNSMPADSTGWNDPFSPFQVDFTGWERGFFGMLTNATVENLTLDKLVIKAGPFCGGLTPYSNNSTIRNVHITESTVRSSLGEYGGGVGGMVYHNQGTLIENCTADVDARGTRCVGVMVGINDSASVIRNCSVEGYSYASSTSVGGLVGVTNGLIERSHSSATVCHGPNKLTLNSVGDCGGFAGDNFGTIRDCYSTGNVVMSYVEAHGFCGRNAGRIENCYCTGNVEGTGAVNLSAFCGINGIAGTYGDPDTPGKIINCYSASTCTVTNPDHANITPNAFVGSSYAPGVSYITNCYYDRDKNPVVILTKAHGALDVTTTYMQSQEFVDSLNMMAALLGLTRWQYNPGGTPTLTNEKATNITDYFAGGSGTKEDPWRITTKEHLKNFARYVNHGYHFAGKYLLQTADIVLNPPFELWGEQMPEMWEPIGKIVTCYNTAQQPFDFQYYFNGCYDGGLHTIQNMYAYSVTHGTGLFGKIYHNARILNLGVTDAYVKGAGVSGILLANAERYGVNNEIRQCWTSGSIEGINGANVFGIVGNMPLEGLLNMYNCYTNATVTGGPESQLFANLNILDDNILVNAYYYNDLTNWNLINHVNVDNYFVNRDLVAEQVFDTLRYPDYARSTEYMQSAAMVNRMNAFVSDYNAQHADDPLLYWQVNEGAYPTFTTALPPHTITYISNGGSQVASQRVYDNTHAYAPEMPTKEGEQFYGWFTDANLEHIYKFDSALVTNDITLYAKWQSEITPDYTIFNNPFSTSYIIRTPGQLLGFAHAIKGIPGVIEKKDFTGKTVKLCNDITLNDTIGWREWGNNAYAINWESMAIADQFNGTFDGQGYSINGMYCTPNNRDNQHWGLFANIGTKGVVKNLNMKAACITYEDAEGLAFGTIAGRNHGQLINCHVEGRIHTRNCDVGLLVGKTVVAEATYAELDSVKGNLINCSAKGEIINIPTPNVAYHTDYRTGGLIAYTDASRSSIRNCEVDVTIESNILAVGGLVGRIGAYNRNQSIYIDSCDVTARIKAGSNVGGFVGDGSANIRCSNSTANIDITAIGNHVGGIVGHADSYNSGTMRIFNCTATGNIASTGGGIGGIAGYIIDTVDNCHSDVDVTALEYAGGLVGHLHGNTNGIFNSHAEGDVTATGQYVGGAVGYDDSAYGLNNCYATGNVTGGDNVGGLVGYSWTVNDSYATGNVYGNDNVGGLLGYGSAHRIHATGNVTGSNCVGGIAGGGRIVSHAYATGTVTGTSKVGGIIGSLYLNSYPQYDSLLYCTAANQVIATGDYVGGLAGYTEGGNIQYSRATGSVTTQGNYVGGLSGHKGSIYNCYSTASIAGNDYIGGLAGAYAYISYSYSAGTVQQGESVQNYGGLQGSAYSNNRTYYDSTLAPFTGDEGHDTQWMTTFGNYEEWNFETVWGMRATYNNGYPYLHHFMPDSLKGMIDAITIDKHALLMATNSTKQLQATTRPASFANQIVWSSDDIAIAEVTNGLITAKSAGTTVIRVQSADGTMGDSCVVTVMNLEDMPAITINFKNTDNWQNVYIYAYSTDHNEYLGGMPGTRMTATKDQWYTITLDQSIREVYFKIHDNYYFTSTELYTEESVCYTWDGYYFTANITDCDQLPIVVNDVIINADAIELVTGDSYPLTATVLPAEATDKSVTWRSMAPSIATVDDQGKVTAQSEGTTYIIVTTNEMSLTDTCVVTVTARATPDVAVTGITLNTSMIDMIVGDTYQLIATIAPTDATNQNINWSSLDPSKVTVDDNGLLTAHAEGTATILAITEDGGKMAMCTVIVSKNNTSNVTEIKSDNSNKLVKVFIDGTIYILHNGQYYTLDGKPILDKK